MRDQDEQSPQLPEETGEPEETGRQRLLTALRKPVSRSHLAAGVLLGLLGFAAVVQVQANDQDDRYAGASQQDLIQLINSQQLAQDRVEAQIRDLERTRDALSNDTAAIATALELARRQSASLGILAGTLPAVGSGIVVTLDGPPESLDTRILVNGIQELRSAGAEAMQINKAVRLVGSSSIADGPGDSVIIDGKQVLPPFVIEAIGSPAGLEKAVYFPQGFADDVREADGQVRVRQVDRIEITTTRTVPSPQYAKPVPEG